jgi:hypothetical protein
MTDDEARGRSVRAAPLRRASLRSRGAAMRDRYGCEVRLLSEARRHRRAS